MKKDGEASRRSRQELVQGYLRSRGTRPQSGAPEDLDAHVQSALSGNFESQSLEAFKESFSFLGRDNMHGGGEPTVNATNGFPDELTMADAIRRKLPSKEAKWEGWVQFFADEDIDTVGDLRRLTSASWEGLQLSALLRSVLSELRDVEPAAPPRFLAAPSNRSVPQIVAAEPPMPAHVRRLLEGFGGIDMKDLNLLMGKNDSGGFVESGRILRGAVEEDEVAFPRGQDLELDIDGNVIEESDELALPDTQLGAWEADAMSSQPLDAVWSEVMPLESRDSEDDEDRREMLETTLQSDRHGLTLRGPLVARDPLPGTSMDLVASSATLLAPSDPHAVPRRRAPQESSPHDLILPRSDQPRPAPRPAVVPVGGSTLRFSAPLPDGLEEGEGGPTAEELEGDLEELDLDADQTGTRENIREARLEPLERKVDSFLTETDRARNEFGFEDGDGDSEGDGDMEGDLEDLDLDLLPS